MATFKESELLITYHFVRLARVCGLFKQKLSKEGNYNFSIEDMKGLVLYKGLHNNVSCTQAFWNIQR